MISCSLLRASVAAVALFGAVSPGWAQLLNQEGLRAATASVTGNPANPALSTSAPKLTPEMRGDIFMARKMFREAIDKFRECPPSAALTTKSALPFTNCSNSIWPRKTMKRR